jgi:hypothetical protein
MNQQEALQIIGTLLTFLEANTGDFVTGASGAFFGALAAFLFERWRSRRDREDEHHSAVLRVQMTLIFNINSLINLKRSLLDPYRDLPTRESQIPHFSQITNTFAVDLDSLSFFLEEGSPNLLMDIYLADRGYHNAIDSIRCRNDALCDIRNTAEVLGFDSNTGQANIVADLTKLKLLKDSTDAMYICIEKALESNQGALSCLRSAAQKVLRGRKLIRFEIEPEPSAIDKDSTL